MNESRGQVTLYWTGSSPVGEPASTSILSDITDTIRADDLAPGNWTT